MAKKLKKVDLRKKRAKLLKERQKQQGKQEIKKKKISEKEEALEIRLKKETKLYWIRGAAGALSALIGRLSLGLVGWLLFFWMLFFWFIFPFIVNILLGYKFDKEEGEWTWKNVIKPGIGLFFFLFMLVGIFIHTMLAFYCQDLGGFFCQKVSLADLF